ncbi:hypothetical protein COO60DRAFT_460015 [Scenedesmus sp. NREL 46B-D3]|nr:hypothetical protein COO60DRAFT_460015 [Scenedesmus sp. NREL 46B-D3]
MWQMAPAEQVAWLAGKLWTGCMHLVCAAQSFSECDAGWPIALACSAVNAVHGGTARTLHAVNQVPARLVAIFSRVCAYRSTPSRMCKAVGKAVVCDAQSVCISNDFAPAAACTMLLCWVCSAAPCSLVELHPCKMGHGRQALERKCHHHMKCDRKQHNMVHALNQQHMHLARQQLVYGLCLTACTSVAQQFAAASMYCGMFGRVTPRRRQPMEAER